MFTRPDIRAFEPRAELRTGIIQGSVTATWVNISIIDAVPSPRIIRAIAAQSSTLWIG
jgi:hypothetical protein